MHPNVAGALVNSALFLGGLLVAGLAMSKPYAVYFALLAMAFAFFSHAGQLIPSVHRIGVLLAIFLSWLVGLLGLLALVY